MKSVMCVLPAATDATSLYRGVGPMQALRRRMDINLIVCPEINWATLKACDAMFLQRPFTKAHSDMVDRAIANRKPIWVDYDDNLFTVPMCNKTYRIYNDAGIQHNISSMIAKADVVTVSTVELGDYIKGILAALAADPKKAPPNAKLDPGKVYLVPNAYDADIMMPLQRDYQPSTLVTWRGSGTHDKDLMGFTPEICRVVGRHLDWSYSLVGEPFWWTVEQLSQVKGVKDRTVICVPTIDPIDYFAFLDQIKPAMMIVPLEDIPFNRAKSNIAWIEATQAGAVTLAPDWPEWRRPGIINFSDPADFEKKMETVIRGEIDTRTLWQRSRDFIAQELTLPKVNHVRELILRNLLERT